MKILTTFILAAALAACTASESDQSMVEEKLAVAGDGAVTLQAADMASAPAPVRTAPAAVAGQALANALPTAMLVRNAHARVEIDSLELAVAAVQAMTTRLGGYVVGVATQTGEQQVREATITARVPSARFDEALSGLDPLGNVESVNVTSEDVGEEFVDVNVRLENGKRLERRLRQLLDTRTGKLEEVLAVERELARVREEIERLEGRVRFLRNRADLATLTVSVHEPLPLLAGYQGQHVLMASVRQAWRNFVGLIAGLIASLGVIVPIALVGAVITLVVRRRRAHAH